MAVDLHYAIRNGDSYDEVFSSGIKTLASALQRRQSTHPLHITYISTAGVYGDHQGPCG